MTQDVRRTETAHDRKAAARRNPGGRPFCRHGRSQALPRPPSPPSGTPSDGGEGITKTLCDNQRNLQLSSLTEGIGRTLVSRCESFTLCFAMYSTVSNVAVTESTLLHQLAFRP